MKTMTARNISTRQTSSSCASKPQRVQIDGLQSGVVEKSALSKYGEQLDPLSQDLLAMAKGDQVIFDLCHHALKIGGTLKRFGRLYTGLASSRLTKGK